MQEKEPTCEKFKDGRDVGEDEWKSLNGAFVVGFEAVREVS